MADADAKHGIEKASLTDQLAHLQKELRSFQLPSGGSAKDDQLRALVTRQTRKLEEELEEAQSESRQLVSARLDIRLLENELKAMRINGKSTESQLRDVKDENVAMEQELNSARIDTRAMKSQVLEHKSQCESLKQQLDAARETITSFRTGGEHTKLQETYAEDLERLSRRHNLQLEEANARLEKAMQAHADYIEELTGKHAEGMEDVNVRYTSALGMANDRCEGLAAELSSALKFIEEMEGQGAVSAYADAMKSARRAKGSGSNSDSDRTVVVTVTVTVVVIVSVAAVVVVSMIVVMVLTVALIVA